MSFPRMRDGPWFLVFLVLFQLAFIVLLYERGLSVTVFGFLKQAGSFPWDYSRSYDVYANLSFFTPGKDGEQLPYCKPKSPVLVGPLNINFVKIPSLTRTIKKNPYVRLGGRYSPLHCQARYKSAIIIPLESGERRLHHLLYYLHPFLQRQQLQYGIYVIHQAGNSTYNRAKLLNVGVWEALKEEEWDCLLLHDVDLVPENDYNLYICDDYYPKHMSSAIDTFQYRLPYRRYFGGVSAVTPEQYLKMNGFPNSYWGWWTGEDDDIATRIYLAGMRIARIPVTLGRYKMIKYNVAKGIRENRKRSSRLVRPCLPSAVRN
nr:PREDICTED: beta-1,4-galactosyltransferase 3-like isoform X2 [Latimeria chalumnae]|eukprot:XP_006013107.1 PREDICTED: beta-1,4-galactosyltransferase 3-like isoform X2 [Latimeria chalumnae]